MGFYIFGPLPAEAYTKEEPIHVPLPHQATVQFVQR